MTTIHPHGYWLEANPQHSHDAGLARSIAALKPPSILDLGCGDGWYLQQIKPPCALGLDGNPHTQAITGGRCFTADLTQPISLPGFEYVLSLEVGEHIPGEHAAAYLDNVCSNALRCVILSWAVPGQGGVGHINCQPLEWVVAEMDARGFFWQRKASFSFRHACKVSWLKRNVQVYTRKDTTGW